VSARALGLTTDSRLRRRQFVNLLMQALATAAAMLAVGLLLLMVGSVASRGASALDLNLLTKTPVPFGQTGGGLAHAFVGSAILVGLATAMALPLGVLIAIYVTELAPRARPHRFSLRPR
jgi:phosphate transport system permease protein